MGHSEERTRRHASPDRDDRHSRRDKRRHRSRERERSPRRRRSRTPDHRRHTRRSPEPPTERSRQQDDAPPPANGRRQAPPRPDTRHVDKSIDAPDFAEFRRLKRLRLAEDATLTIWPRSPSPEPEPLLEADGAAAPAGAEEGAKEAPAAAAVAVAEDPEVEELDQAELALFMEWLQERKDALAEERARAERAAEAARPVGPAKPGSEQEAADGADGAYGGNLRPGEGERMAAFAKSGARIPRRGEIGMSDEEIKMYETVGYVMSGSRHSRMNAVRMRKENQVYTAEEKAALALFNKQEAERKEAALIANMQALVHKAVADVDAPPRGEGA